MQYHSAGLTDVGQRRKLNEDAFLVDDDLGLYVVADGMGGHAAGEIASEQAVETVHGMVIRGHGALDKVAQGDTSEDSLRQAIRVVESAVQAATYMVFGLAQHDPNQQGMGTTVSVTTTLPTSCRSFSKSWSRSSTTRTRTISRTSSAC